MQYTNLLSNGQVTLPKSVRDRLRLKEGTEFAVSTRGRSVILQPVGNRTWRRWRGLLKGTNALRELEREHRREVRAR